MSNGSQKIYVFSFERLEKISFVVLRMQLVDPLVNPALIGFAGRLLSFK